MILSVVFILYTVLGVELKRSSEVSSTCNSDLSACFNDSTAFSEYYSDNNKKLGSSEVPMTGPGRRGRGRSGKGRKRNYSRRRSGRRKTHRHSTRVLTVKPPLILLPPFETLPDHSNRLDPFIINLISDDNATVAPTLIVPTTEISRPTTRRTPRTRTVPPPNQWLLPPLLESPNNDIGMVQIDTAKDSRAQHGYSTTVLYESTSPVQNGTSSVNPFESLEKEYNEIIKITGGNILELVVSNETNSEDYSSSSYSSSDNAGYGWSSTPTYNASEAENNLDSIEEERLEQKSVNSFASARNAFSVPNNTLLAPDVASLGMKIVTSKKGLQMVKEFTITNKTRSRSDKRRHRNNRRNKANLNLETAETGDFRNHAYENQILSLEDTSKEGSRTLQGPHKPFLICNGNEGYVADPASGCQVFYICLGRGAGEPMMCPNGTLFNQDFLVCDWWYNVECKR